MLPSACYILSEWVPGHWDIVSNCIADELPRQVTIMALLPEKEIVGMPMAIFKLNIKNSFNKLANTLWQSATQCRVSHQTWPVINSKKNFGSTQKIHTK